MNRRPPVEERARQVMRVLPLTIALSIPICVIGADHAVADQTSSVVSQKLEQGKPVTRNIAEGETHSYGLTLKAGEFVHVIIRQLGINVSTTLLAPDGKKLVEADSPLSTQEPEWITYLASSAGDYRVDVRTVDKGVPAGQYEIEIDEQRTRKDGDENRVSAEIAFNEATQLFREKNYRNAIVKYQEAQAIYHQASRRVEEAVTLNSLARSSGFLNDYQTAIERYKAALQIYRDNKDVNGEGITLHALGSAYVNLDQYDEGIANLEQALQARRKTGYRFGEAATLLNLGLAYSRSGRQEKAIDNYELALKIFREVKDRSSEGRTLSNIGLAYNLISQYDKAIEYYEQALKLSRELKDRLGEARALGNLGKVCYDRSRFEDSIKYSEQAVIVFKEVNDQGGQGVALNNIGLSNNSLGRYDKAIDYYEQALKISREAKDHSNEGRILNNIGNSYYLLGRYDKSIDYYQQGLELRRRVHDRRGEGITLGNLGKAYNSLGQYQKSIETQQQALAIKREVQDRSGEGHTLNDLGNTYLLLKQYDRALECYQQALVINRAVKDRVAEADSLAALGGTYSSLTQYEKAIDLYQQSLPISREVKDRPSEGRTLDDLMGVWSQLNNKAVAIFYGKQAVNVYQQIRGNIKSLDKQSQQTYVKSHENAYRKLADLLISQGRLGEAEKVLELLKEEEFNQVARRNGLSDPTVGYSKSETEAANINDQLALLASERGPLLAKVASGSATDQDRLRLNQIEAAITEANKKIKLVLSDIAKVPTEQAMMTERSQSMMQTLRKLGAGTVALYTVVADNKGWIILTTPDFRRAYPINTTDLNKLVSDFRLTLKNDQYDPVPLAQNLYRALFLQKNDEGTTLAADLKACHARTLMWSLDGVLRYVPISALHDGKGYLIEKYSSLVFTIASLTRLLDSSEENWSAFGLGVSKQHENFPALVAVPRELHSIIRETGVKNSTGVMPGTILLDEQFTRQSMIDGLRVGYPVVHIASHFRFIPESADNSYLLLGDGSNYSLAEMQDSPGIFERVELLTLSACDTATSGSNGKEMEGLAFIAQELGAKAVVASLWPVADVGTEVLMREFYQLKETNSHWSKAEALRQAQIALLKGDDDSSREATQHSRGIGLAKENESDPAMKVYARNPKAPFAHPHYWAPFILIGNWK